MARKCKNCKQETLVVKRSSVVTLRVVCENCGEINALRTYPDEAEYHDNIHRGGRDKEKYNPENQSDERPVSRE